ncbi:MAG TPA: RNA polymerase sigma-54 factor, partial [Caulobacteraceae bacterium]|nr:RNA polymerase sigma-54 factor [Caulobacteraceae bacterium]
MALSPRLELRQGQGLVITPQLQQAIKLLQLSNLELEAYVDAELERNPLLQRDDREGESENDAEASKAEAEASDDDFAIDRMTDSAAAADIDARHDDLYDAASPGDHATGDIGAGGGADAGGSVDWSKAGKGGGFEEGDGERDGADTRELSLAEHLENQLSVAGLADSERLIALTLIDAVDEGGYLRADLAELAGRLGCDEARIEAVLAKLQGFEPTGVFARDVAECLTLQLKENNRFDPAMAALVANLELLARRDMAALKRLCGVDDEDLRDMIAELKALTPRPGAAFGGEMAQVVVPDVYVREGAQGLWLVELNTDTLPKLLVDHRYHARVSAGARGDQEKTFVSDCLSSANWLVKSLDQRARTILKV